MGTPLYMSPEQCAGEETDARADLYAVGLILYEMISGTRPFSEESTSDLLFARTQKNANSLLAEFPDMDLPAELDAVLAKALARRREDRYQSAEEMLAALESIPLSDSGSWGASSINVPTASEMRQSAPRPITAGGVPAPAEGRGKSWVLGFSLVGIVAVAIAFIVYSGGLSAVDGPGDGSGDGSGDGARDGAGDVTPVSSSLRLRDKPAEALTPAERQYLGTLDIARTAIRTGNLISARASLNEALLAECVDSEAYVVQAEVLRANGDADAALVSYDEALRLDATDVAALLGRGWVHLERDDLVAAGESLEAGRGAAAQSAGGSDEGAVLTLEGTLALRRKELEEARAAFGRALSLDPRNTTALLYLGRLELDAGNDEAAVEALVQAKLHDPTSARALAWLGEAYLELERYDEAETQLRASLELDDAAETRRTLGALLVDQGRFLDAELFIGEAILRHGTDARLRVLHALALQGMGRTDSALISLERAGELDADGETHLLAALMNHRLDRNVPAVSHYRRALELLGQVPAANLGLGIALFEAGDHAGAARHFQLVLDYDPDDAAAHYHLGLLKMDYLGDYAGARRNFERYMQLDGTDERVRDWIRRL